MVNKKFWLGMLVMVLAFGMTVVGCEDDPTDVKLNQDKLPEVKSVTVAKTTNNRYFIVSWDAVKGEANSYTLYFKQEGKVSSTSVTNGQNLYIYDPATGNPQPNDNLDKWSVRINSVTSYATVGGSYCFGVRTNSGSTAISSTASDIKWSSAFALTNGPKITTVTAVKTTDDSNIIVSWDAVAGAVDYDCYMFYSDSSTTSSYSSGPAQNSQTYAVADGTGSANTNPSKWSFKAYNYTAYGYDCYFTVTPIFSDVSILPTVPTNSNTLKP
jgi:hypothetical protein